MTAHLDAITMPEFLEARYNSKLLRPISAIVVFIFLLPYSASVYKGLGHLFEANLGIDYIYAELIMAFFTGVYLLLGGYLAITITDFFQGLLQITGIIVMVLLLAGGAGGIFEATTTLSAIEAPAMAAEGLFPGWMILLGLVVLTSVGPWGLPQMTQKFYSVKHTRDIKPALVVSAFFSILIAGGAYYCGSLSHLYFTPETLPAEPDMIIPELIAMPMMPDWFAALIIVVVLAASMSTLASLVLVASGAISIDLLGLRARGDDASDTGLKVLRVLCGVFVALSVVIAGAKVTFIVNLMAISWGALAGAFIGPYVYGLFWKRANLTGAVASMASGLLTSVGLFIYWGGPGVPVASALAMLVPLIVMPIASLLSSPMDDSHVSDVFDFDAEMADEEEVAAE
jgi:SSS family solute:Na+ symporter